MAERDEVLSWAEARTPCQRFPERCRRREIAHVVLDADGVLWTIEPHAIASSVCPPYRRVDEDTVEAGEGACHEERPKKERYRWAARWWEEEPPPSRKVTVRLLPGLRDTLDRLKGLGVTASVSSLNSPGSVKGLLKAFGLLDEFVEVRDVWDPKRKSVREMAERRRIAPCGILFVDDTLHNVEEVSELGALGLHMGRDIRAIGEILDYMR